MTVLAFLPQLLWPSFQLLSLRDECSDTVKMNLGESFSVLRTLAACKNWWHAEAVTCASKQHIYGAE